MLNIDSGRLVLPKLLHYPDLTHQPILTFSLGMITKVIQSYDTTPHNTALSVVGEEIQTSSSGELVEGTRFASHVRETRFQDSTKLLLKVSVKVNGQ